VLGPVDAFSNWRTVEGKGDPDSAVFTDLGELGTFHAVGRVAELPKLDMVGELESLEEDGDFVGVRASVVGVKNEGFDIARHLGFRNIICDCQGALKGRIGHIINPSQSAPHLLMSL